ncbi:MAG: nickel pincer cofactor biosynthesis protein LarB [Desulfofustis sp.]|nr:nickel pincer cofactor biosynthesis protein LarB [Desulfofustis sp.]
MDQRYLETLLNRLLAGTLTIPETLDQLKSFPAETVRDACLDHQRLLRTGIPEVIYGEAKTAEQIVTIARAILDKAGPLLITRVDQQKATLISEELPQLTYHQQARLLTGPRTSTGPVDVRGTILVVCAGTSDIAIAEEARLTAEHLGNPVRSIYDAGVAGLHRLLVHHDLLREASVIIVVAGMEGALPSVVGGLVSCPVIGVPTSVGYGTGAGGFAALLGMLNSCAPGLAVVNIDNGFGAGCLAAAINRNR